MKIENQQQLEDYISHIQIKGLGGTDFRPAFRYVEKLIEEREFLRLAGMIYFTDGYGIFPEYRPKFQTVFAFIENGNRVSVPAWAMQIYWKASKEHEYI